MEALKTLGILLWTSGIGGICRREGSLSTWEAGFERKPHVVGRSRRFIRTSFVWRKAGCRGLYRRLQTWIKPPAAPGRRHCGQTGGRRPGRMGRQFQKCNSRTFATEAALGWLWDGSGLVKAQIGCNQDTAARAERSRAHRSPALSKAKAMARVRPAPRVVPCPAP
jgi:hypothetical protein